jgi:hypothetical protein
MVIVVGDPRHGFPDEIVETLGSGRTFIVVLALLWHPFKSVPRTVHEVAVVKVGMVMTVLVDEVLQT